jgi:hypothetical protein
VSHYDAVVLGTVRHVPASEPLFDQMRTFPSGSGFARAVGVETVSSKLKVTRTLASSSFGALPARSAYSLAQSGPSSAGIGRGFAFSATRRRLYVLGGEATPAAYSPLNEGWWLDLPTGQWRQFAFPSGETVGTVASAVFRWQDDSVYFLDKSSSTLRLRRWNAQRNVGTGVVQTLATFPSSWNAFAKYDLVATPAGDLLLVAWEGTGTQKTWVGRVAVDASSIVSLAALRKSTTPIVSPPAAGHTGYTSIVRATVAAAATEPYGTSVTFSSMAAPPLADLPTILPH